VLVVLIILNYFSPIGKGFSKKKRRDPFSLPPAAGEKTENHTFCNTAKNAFFLLFIKIFGILSEILK